MEHKGLKPQETGDWVVKNRLDGQAGMIMVSSDGEVPYGFNSNAMFRGCATKDGFMEGKRIFCRKITTYKTLKSTIDKASKKLESMKSTTDSAASTKSKTKKIDRVETSLKESSRDLSMSKFKSGGVVALVLFVVFGLLNSLFEGKAVAKLPFHPASLVQKMSHRGVVGDDVTDCSMAFLYFLCSISIRTNLQKFLGFAPPRGAANAGLFPMPDPKTN
ncbi:hypothetical protein Sjap_024689 [Stephania japonica]|uniref:Calcium load-activated calcium channel n=1 Tax=Stephania japonica TaxID=461633 RepID=A0AAP0HNY8_9MAGN